MYLDALSCCTGRTGETASGYERVAFKESLVTTLADFEIHGLMNQLHFTENAIVIHVILSSLVLYRFDSTHGRIYLDGHLRSE